MVFKAACEMCYKHQQCAQARTGLRQHILLRKWRLSLHQTVHHNTHTRRIFSEVAQSYQCYHGYYGGPLGSLNHIRWGSRLLPATATNSTLPMLLWWPRNLTKTMRVLEIYIFARAGRASHRGNSASLRHSPCWYETHPRKHVAATNILKS